jgi:hypothetical protein
VVNPRNPSLEAWITLRRAAPGPSAPAMSVVRLDFEVFADVVMYIAYDSIAFGSFFSILRNAILGLSPEMEIEQLIIETHRLTLIQQAGNIAPRGCVLEELNNNAAALVDHEGEAAPEAEEQEKAEDELQMLKGRTEGFPGRHRKMTAPLDTSLLRRSARIEALNQGFKPNLGSTNTSAASSATPSNKEKAAKNKGKAVMLMKEPLYVGRSTPGVAPAPHLSINNARAIGTRFCKMPPGAVSDEVLLAGEDEDAAI